MFMFYEYRLLAVKYLKYEPRNIDQTKGSEEYGLAVVSYDSRT